MAETIPAVPVDGAVPWWLSKTIVVNVASIIAVIAAKYGLDLDAEVLFVILVNVATIIFRITGKNAKVVATATEANKVNVAAQQKADIVEAVVTNPELAQQVLPAAGQGPGA